MFFSLKSKNTLASNTKYINYFSSCRNSSRWGLALPEMRWMWRWTLLAGRSWALFCPICAPSMRGLSRRTRNRQSSGTARRSVEKLPFLSNDKKMLFNQLIYWNILLVLPDTLLCIVSVNLQSTSNGLNKVKQSYFFMSYPVGDSTEWGEGEQRGSERSPEWADREAALPADPGGGAGESPQTGEKLHFKRKVTSRAKHLMTTHRDGG